MQVYQNEDEQVEALKAWWDQNGKQMLILVAAVLVGVFAYRNYLDHRIGQEEQASQRYSLITQLQSSDAEAARAQVESLKQEQSKSHYALIAALTAARMAVDKGNWTQATTELNWILQQNPPSPYADLTRLRLARVEMAQNHDEVAKTLLNQSSFAPPFQGEVQELLGDLALKAGDRSGAATHYQQALSLYEPTAPRRATVEMKRADLATTAADLKP